MLCRRRPLLSWKGRRLRACIGGCGSRWRWSANRQGAESSLAARGFCLSTAHSCAPSRECGLSILAKGPGSMALPVAESRQGADRNLPAVSDHLALQVLRQCGMMQQQMAEQHQQVMSFLCQFLTSFRKESQEAILEEIREFRRATLELQTLQARLA